MNNPPTSRGYRMPAEWEPHTSTWLTWPQTEEFWPDAMMDAMESVYVSMIRALTTGENINLLVNSKAKAKSVEALLTKDKIPVGRVHIHIIPTNDVWIRDYGPNFIVGPGGSGKLAFNKWDFNSWGDKYDFTDDREVTTALVPKLGISVFHPGIVLEGGAIEVNGVGTCITTEQCLLNNNRNGELTRADMEKFLQDYLGVRKVIWCKGGCVGDDTDGHIDNLARFVTPNTVLCAWEENLADVNHANLKKNHEALLEAVDQDGKKLNVIRIPMPEYIANEKTRLPASYANFYIGTRAVLVPAYNHPNDQKVQDLLKEFFPDREVVGIPSRTLITGYGGIHCITQQQPKA